MAFNHVWALAPGLAAAALQFWARQGTTSMVMTPEALDSYARDDIAKWSRVIKTAGIKAD